jgi:hypothetical protein
LCFLLLACLSVYLSLIYHKPSKTSLSLFLVFSSSCLSVYLWYTTSPRKLSFLSFFYSLFILLVFSSLNQSEASKRVNTNRGQKRSGAKREERGWWPLDGEKEEEETINKEVYVWL